MPFLRRVSVSDAAPPPPSRGVSVGNSRREDSPLTTQGKSRRASVIDHGPFRRTSVREPGRLEESRRGSVREPRSRRSASVAHPESSSRHTPKQHIDSQDHRSSRRPVIAEYDRRNPYVAQAPSRRGYEASDYYGDSNATVKAGRHDTVRKKDGQLQIVRHKGEAPSTAGKRELSTVLERSFADRDRSRVGGDSSISDVVGKVKRGVTRAASRFEGESVMDTRAGNSRVLVPVGTRTTADRSSRARSSSLTMVQKCPVHGRDLDDDYDAEMEYLNRQLGRTRLDGGGRGGTGMPKEIVNRQRAMHVRPDGGLEMMESETYVRFG